MNGQLLYRATFGEEPSPDAVGALDELARLAGLDDPFFIIAMFLQRQVGLLEDRGKLFLTYTGEIERAAEVLRDRSQEVRAAADKVNGAASFVTTHTGEANAAIQALKGHVADLIYDVDQGAHQTRQATAAMTEQNLLFRLDIKLAMAVAALLGIAAIVLMAVLLVTRPPMSVESAAVALVGRDMAPSLVELQRQGDLQALLACEGEGWHKRIGGYCQPLASAGRVRGWNTAPRPAKPERAAPFDRK